MPLQTSGPISLNDIAGEFGGSVPHSLSEYYGAASGIPSSGTISFSQFYGASASVTISASFILHPTYIKGGPSGFVLANPPLNSAWTVYQPNHLAYPRATPFSVAGSANWPVYCETYFWLSYPNEVMIFPNPNALVFNCALNSSNFPAGVTFVKTFVSAEIYQNGTLLYTASTFSNISQNGYAKVEFYFNADLMQVLLNRFNAGNRQGYEMRITYVP